MSSSSLTDSRAFTIVSAATDIIEHALGGNIGDDGKERHFDLQWRTYSSPFAFFTKSPVIWTCAQ